MQRRLSHRNREGRLRGGGPLAQGLDLGDEIHILGCESGGVR